MSEHNSTVVELLLEIKQELVEIKESIKGQSSKVTVNMDAIKWDKVTLTEDIMKKLKASSRI